MEYIVAILHTRIGGLPLGISISSLAWKYCVEWDDFYKKDHSVGEGENISYIFIGDEAITVQILFIFFDVHNEIHGLSPVVNLKPVLVLYQLVGVVGCTDTESFLPVCFPFLERSLLRWHLSSQLMLLLCAGAFQTVSMCSDGIFWDLDWQIWRCRSWRVSCPGSASNP